MRILVVEDELLIALDLEDMLVRLGHEIVGPAPSRRRALELAGHAPIALVDVRLADGPTGPGIAETLAADHGTTVIFTTANPEAVWDNKAAICVVTKPYSEEAIAQALDYALAHREGRQVSPPRLVTRIPVAL